MTRRGERVCSSSLITNPSQGRDSLQMLHKAEGKCIERKEVISTTVGQNLHIVRNVKGSVLNLSMLLPGTG